MYSDEHFSDKDDFGAETFEASEKQGACDTCGRKRWWFENKRGEISGQVCGYGYTYEKAKKATETGIPADFCRGMVHNPFIKNAETFEAQDAFRGMRKGSTKIIEGFDVKKLDENTYRITDETLKDGAFVAIMYETQIIPYEKRHDYAKGDWLWKEGWKFGEVSFNYGVLGGYYDPQNPPPMKQYDRSMSYGFNTQMEALKFLKKAYDNGYFEDGYLIFDAETFEAESCDYCEEPVAYVSDIKEHPKCEHGWHLYCNSCIGAEDDFCLLCVEGEEFEAESNLSEATLKRLRRTYDTYEDTNQHTANYLLLATFFGTDAEKDEVKRIMKRRDRRGYLTQEESDWMYKNINPYYDHLRNVKAAESFESEDDEGRDPRTDSVSVVPYGDEFFGIADILGTRAGLYNLLMNNGSEQDSSITYDMIMKDLENPQKKHILDLPIKVIEDGEYEDNEYFVKEINITDDEEASDLIGDKAIYLVLQKGDDNALTYADLKNFINENFDGTLYVAWAESFEASGKSKIPFDVINIEYQYESDFDMMSPSDNLLNWDYDMTVSVKHDENKHFSFTKDAIRAKLESYISRQQGEPVKVVDFTAFYAGTNDPLRGNYEDYEAETFEAKEKKIGSIRIVKNPNFPSGTSLQAYIKTNRAELRKVFGNPNMGESGDGESKGKEWNLVVGPHRVTIYDKREKDKKGTKYFNIGGSRKYAALLVAQALSIHRNERVYAKEILPQWLEDKRQYQQVKSIDEHPDLTYHRAKEYEDNRRRYGAESFEAKGIDTFAKPFEEIGIPKTYARLGVITAGITALAFGVMKLKDR